MRDKRFVAEHHGVPLKNGQHRQLLTWDRDYRHGLTATFKRKKT
jgi:hypothetical protein